jgi:hypothetical protein
MAFYGFLQFFTVFTGFYSFLQLFMAFYSFLWLFMAFSAFYGFFHLNHCKISSKIIYYAVKTFTVVNLLLLWL